MANKFTPQIRLTSRDFNSIRNDLRAYAKRYYPNVANDLSDNSSLSLDIDLVSYVGDMLSFYVDYTANEMFPDSAVEYKNVVRNAEQAGYRFQPFPSSVGTCAFFIKVPAATVGTGPDEDYLGKLKKNSTFSSTDGNLFTLLEDVDFSSAAREVVVAEVDETSGVPTSYAVKMYGEVISGELITETITVGAFQKYLKLRLGSRNITEVVSVFDAEGHEYKEVNYLSQDVVYESVPNFDADKDEVPAILRLTAVPRRFITTREGTETFLQFGHGSDSELSDVDVLDPANVVIQQYGRKHITDDAFDPNKLLKGDKLGISPANTTLTVAYRVNTNDNVNAEANTIENVERAIIEFNNPTGLSEASKRTTIGSVEVVNEEAIVGDVSLPTVDELKIHALNAFPTQNRAVTKEDYEAMVYRMPAKFGAIKRCAIMQDPDSFKRNLNLYVISENSLGKLTEAPNRLKKNLKTWIADYKMINDTIDILDGKILNLGVDFRILSSLDYDKFDVLEACRTKLVAHFATLPQMGEPFYITDIFKQLNQVVGVVDVVDVRVRNDKTFGGSYSNYVYDVDRNTSSDGRRIYVPSNVVWEVKFPNEDIRGEVM